jgi:transposase InsO family protein
MDFTYVCRWAGFVYVAFIVDVFAQKIVTWNAATAKDTGLVMRPLRMAIWQRERDGHPVVPGELIGHADARVRSIHVHPVHRASRPRGRPTLDRLGR